MSRFVLCTTLVFFVALPLASFGQGLESLVLEARSSRMQGKDRDALETFAKAAERFPGSVEPLIQMGAILEDQGKWREAMKRYRQALRIDPHNATALRNLTQLRSSREVNEPITTNPSKEWLIQIGLRALERGHIARATQVFSLSRELLKDDPRPLHYLAIAAERRGDIEEAVELYEQAIEAFPTFAPARVNLVIALLERGDREKAFKRAQDSLEALPHNQRLAYLARLCSGKPTAILERHPKLVSGGKQAQ